MKRFKGGEEVEVPEIDAFLADIEAVYRKHKMTINHEDTHGGFMIMTYLGDDDPDIEWLRAASDERQ